jgi:hypothetical protein
MEKKTEYNQQAFPCTEIVDDVVCGIMQTTHQHHPGMTLLDYMAGQVVQGLAANESFNHITYAPQIAYAQAAAMLEERKKYINS